MSSALDHPAGLWPTPHADSQSEPQRWVWAAMEPPERRQRMRELAAWVDWLRPTFALHNQIPPCWYRHSPVVEHLSALYVGWVRTYAGEQSPGRELAEADWINTLHAFTPRLQLAACATGSHQEPPRMAPQQSVNDEAFELYLATAEPTTELARHPAAAEVARLAAAEDPPL